MGNDMDAIAGALVVPTSSERKSVRPDVRRTAIGPALGGAHPNVKVTPMISVTDGPDFSGIELEVSDEADREAQERDRQKLLAAGKRPSTQVTLRCMPVIQDAYMGNEGAGAAGGGEPTLKREYTNLAVDGKKAKKKKHKKGKAHKCKEEKKEKKHKKKHVKDIS